ncbi:MAG: hypothetical protein ACFFCW_19780 [Candidatus Hodarchaeota archaeon]
MTQTEEKQIKNAGSKKTAQQTQTASVSKKDEAINQFRLIKQALKGPDPKWTFPGSPG